MPSKVFTGHLQGVHALSRVTAVKASSKYVKSPMAPLHGVLRASGYTHDIQIC